VPAKPAAAPAPPAAAPAPPAAAPAPPAAASAPPAAAPAQPAAAQPAPETSKPVSTARPPMPSLGEAPGPEAMASSMPVSTESAPEPAQTFDLHSPEFYLNRELTWLEFNRRVLHEAEDERTPLLERLKFIAIVSSNLDEFFMKRIGGLKQQLGAGIQDLTVDGRTPRQQIDESYEVIRDMEAHKQELLIDLLEELKKHDICLLSYDELAPAEQEQLREYYLDNIFSLVTPQAVDPAHPFPFISNLSLNLLVTLRYPEQEELHRARVKVPVGSDVPRFLRIGDSNRFVPLEEVMCKNLDLLFPKMEIESCEVFQVTRNANTDPDEENADDLLATIESAVRNRRFAPFVRMTVQEGMDPVRRGMLAAELGLDEDADVFDTSGLLAMRDLFELCSLENPALHDPPHHPVTHASLQNAANIFYVIREAGSILLQHPYESFATSVEQFVKEASRDPKVRAIKMTLYRTSKDTRILEYLIDAARNGKQVAVVVELQARFDEAANIRWASSLEEAGIHVTYGVMGLKTHCKLILVVRRDYNGLRLYAHIGTGNYHAGTARLYDDVGLLTCDEVIGRDVTELFNYLTTGYTPKRDYHKILPAPKLLKRSLIAKIEREIEHQVAGQEGLIQMKMNALEDADITRSLYRAASVGVKVDLIVRDTCRLRPGIEGLSENVRVISVVGRFLEHSRIYYFRNAGDDEYYIGSADCMKRNLEQRVEAVVLVENPLLQQELRTVFDEHLADQRSAWDMQSDGSYRQRQPSDESSASCQQRLAEFAQERDRQAKRLKRRKPKVIGRRNVGVASPKE
jgi:polyphosphate kinase